MKMKQNKISIYCCGGAGINIGSFFENHRDSSEVGVAKVESFYLDTSGSNIKQTFPKENVYLVEGLDGSGKLRKQNHKEIAQCVLDMLVKHRPGTLNIVLSSASGGSGSVIGPTLVNELLKKDELVIVILVGSTDSRIELENTYKTIKSYEAIARSHSAPVVAMYFENSALSSRKIVDGDIQVSISLLASLFSGQNNEMDISDLRNWINYQNVTSYEPKLSNLSFFNKKVEASPTAAIISVATLALNDEVDTSLGKPVEYQCVGFYDSEYVANSGSKDTIHAVVFDGVFDEIFKRLDSNLNEIDQAIQSC
jgi:hypothetical protein